MDKRNALAMDVFLRRTTSQYPHALLADRAARRLHAVRAETEVMYAAGGMTFQKLRYRGLGACRFHQLDFGIAKLDVGEPYALLLVHLRGAHCEPVVLLEPL